NMKRTIDGPPSGVGASYSWSGNDKVGEGRQTITESHPGERVVMRLEFIKPWAAQHTVTFSFAAQGDGTKVTWAMDGHKDFMSKAFSLVMDMDSMIGKDFAAGLSQLKILAESEAQQRAAAEAEARAAAAAAAPPPPAEVPAPAPTAAPSGASN